MADDTVPTLPPSPAPQTMSEMFADYNPAGAAGGLFAPAYVSGYAPSEQAVTAWNATNRPITAANIEETRMPSEYLGNVPMSKGDGVYGHGVPTKQQYLDPRGTIDPVALRVMAQGGTYDMDARRNAIAARIAANAAAAAPAPAVVKPLPLLIGDQ